MKLRGLRADRSTFAELLEIVNDDQRSATKPALHNPAVAVLRAECHVIEVNRVIASDCVDLLLALKFCDRYLRNQDCIVTNLGLRSHSAKLSGTKYVAWIRKRSSNANRPSLAVQLPIYESDVTLMGINFTIRKRQR